MLLSFDAKQKLKLSVTRNKEYLSKYLLEEERVVGAMLDSKKLVPEGVGRYKYTVTSFKVFQLDINPCLLYTSPSPRDLVISRMPSSA